MRASCRAPMKLSILCRAACCWSLWFASRRRGLKGGSSRGGGSGVSYVSCLAGAAPRAPRLRSGDQRCLCTLQTLQWSFAVYVRGEGLPRGFAALRRPLHGALEAREGEGGECPWSPQARAFLCLGRRIRSSRRSLWRRGRQLGPANSVADFSWGS